MSLRLLVVLIVLCAALPGAAFAETTAPDPGDARERLESILEREEFYDSAPQAEPQEIDLGWFGEQVEKMIDNTVILLKKLRDALRERERRKPSNSWEMSEGLQTALLVFLIIVVLGVLAAMGWFLIRTLTESAPLRSASVVRYGENALEHTPDEWHSLAHSRADTGDLRGATRAMYLSLLSELHDKRKIVYDTRKTNWEYLYSMSTNEPLREPFRELTGFFDRCWYGIHEPDKDDFKTFEREVTEMRGQLDE
ncbi:MAG: DUF4129 domain-containing protein [Planctomycetota bacterium]|nr:DUF4129 domain-containing protein [Planctomycetota bacterium]